MFDRFKVMLTPDAIHKKDDYYSLLDMCSRYEESTGELSVVYMNGQFHKLTDVFEIRKRLWG